MRALTIDREGATRALASVLAMLAVPQQAHAQRASENAVTSSDDAFGTNVGAESTGIYSENDTRGFSPKNAGNVRIDGIYFDQVSILAGRLRESTSIRVGFAAQTYPFHAPTGIVDHKFRPMPTELGASVALTQQSYWGGVREIDFRVPIIKDHFALTGGFANGDQRQADGSGTLSWGVTIRPIFRFGGVEIAPYHAFGRFPGSLTHPTVVVNGDMLPQMPEVRKYLGQRWAKGDSRNKNTGVTVKAAITNRLSLRAGLFRSGGARVKGNTEIFSIIPPAPPGAPPLPSNPNCRVQLLCANHIFISDPKQRLHSTSGEAQVAYRLTSGRWQHRFIAGYRMRNRFTETGGSDIRSFGQVSYGDYDIEAEPSFAYNPVNAGRVKQSSWMLGYTGQIEGLGTLNLGLQKARYRATFRDGRTGIVTTSRDDPWLYNATLGIELSPSISLYAGTEKGLEDSGIAPENAVNRNEQLPSTRSTQYEGGVRWKFHGGQLVVNAFQITKPYFSFDNAGVFTAVGQVRHRGVETSLSGHFGKRLNLVAGAVLMQPRVTGAARDLGLAGERPAGTPSLFAKVDANYRTDIFGGLTPTLSFTYTGSRAVGSRPLASLGGKQLMVPGIATLDLGLRQQFKIAGVSSSLRMVLQNVFDAATWKVVAANTLWMDERRRYNLSLTMDF